MTVTSQDGSGEQPPLKKRLGGHRASEEFDRGGYIWTVWHDKTTPALEVWRGIGDLMIIRQEVPPCPEWPEGAVDLVSITTGQAYDLLKVISRLLEET